MKKKYVQVLNGKVNPIVIEEDKVDELRSNGIIIIDVTNISPQPQAGWLYDSQTNTFTAPKVVSVEPNTTIPNITLWNRFQGSEQESLVESSNKKIKHFLYELQIRPTFDLKEPKLIEAINALETTSIIKVGRAAEILKI